jgi:hypothetical protein
MRRLANHSREDTYSSTRDYQMIHDRRSQRFVPLAGEEFKLVFSIGVDADAQGLVCWGGYILSKEAAAVTATLTIEGRDYIKRLTVDSNWRRYGYVANGIPQATKAQLTFEWDDDAVPIEFWGLDIGRPNITRLRSNGPDLSLLDSAHLIPETFYLPHEVAVNVVIEAEASLRFRIEDGSGAKVKKLQLLR